MTTSTRSRRGDGSTTKATRTSTGRTAKAKAAKGTSATRRPAAARPRGTANSDTTPGTGSRRTTPATTATSPHPATATAPATAPVSGPPQPTDERLATILASTADQTVEQLAAAAGVGKSTVAKALARLETAGHAARTRGAGAGRSRQPDTWNAATGQPASQSPAPRGRRTRRGSTPTTPLAAAPDAATGHSPGSSPDPESPQRRNPKSATVRLAPGQLTQLVADHFAKHPNTPLTPGEVGRALGGRSGGAVRNSAEKLTRDGVLVLVLVLGSPRRYTTAA
jgi:Bacterial regulatory proteins, gntR family